MTDQDFEREKWTVERDFKERELKLKEGEAKRSRWLNPLVIAILATAIAGAGNAFAMWINWGAQVDFEKTKAEAARVLEDSKAEATRILEMIKTGDDPDKAATNLQFLLDAGLISDPERRTKLETFLATRTKGEGPTLPTFTSGNEMGSAIGNATHGGWVLSPRDRAPQYGPPEPIENRIANLRQQLEKDDLTQEQCEDIEKRISSLEWLEKMTSKFRGK